MKKIRYIPYGYTMKMGRQSLPRTKPQSSARYSALISTGHPCKVLRNCSQNGEFLTVSDQTYGIKRVSQESLAMPNTSVTMNMTLSLRKSNMKKPPLSKQHGSETPLRKTLQESNCSVTESGVQNADHL